MLPQTSPIAAIQELANAIHQIKSAVSLNAQLATQLSWVNQGPARMVPVAPIADLLQLLTDQLESVEHRAADLEILLNELGLQELRTETVTVTK